VPVAGLRAAATDRQVLRFLHEEVLGRREQRPALDRRTARVKSLRATRGREQATRDPLAAPSSPVIRFLSLFRRHPPRRCTARRLDKRHIGVRHRPASCQLRCSDGGEPPRVVGAGASVGAASRTCRAGGPAMLAASLFRRTRRGRPWPGGRGLAGESPPPCLGFRQRGCAAAPIREAVRARSLAAPAGPSASAQGSPASGQQHDAFVPR